MLQSGHGRKTDGIDARSVALVAQHRNDLSRVAPDDHSAVLRLLSDRRDELTAERRRAVNRLHRLLRDLHPGGAPRQLSADRASRLLATIRPAGVVDIERKTMARQLLADVRRVDRALNDNRRRCAEAVATSGSSLTEMPPTRSSTSCAISHSQSKPGTPLHLAVARSDRVERLRRPDRSRADGSTTFGAALRPSARTTNAR